jgi:hypothetical protein
MVGELETKKNCMANLRKLRKNHENDGATILEKQKNLKFEESGI